MQEPHATPTTIVVTHALPATATVLMMCAAEQDHSGEGKDDFQEKWANPKIKKRLLGASGYDVRPGGEFPTTGRPRLEFTFYRTGAGGDRILLARYYGMELINSNTGAPYVVCSRFPITPEPAIINMTPPRPTLTCLKCGTLSTPAHALITCTACDGKAFDWCCACMPRVVYHPQAAPPVNQLLSEPTGVPMSPSAPSSIRI